MVVHILYLPQVVFFSISFAINTYKIQYFGSYDWGILGGNAGLAAAYAGKNLQTKVTIVVPETTSEEIKKKMRDEGCQVKTIGKVKCGLNVA